MYCKNCIFFMLEGLCCHIPKDEMSGFFGHASANGGEGCKVFKKITMEKRIERLEIFCNKNERY